MGFQPIDRGSILRVRSTIGGSFNGRTTGSDPVNVGSNPTLPDGGIMKLSELKNTKQPTLSLVEEIDKRLPIEGVGFFKRTKNRLYRRITKCLLKEHRKVK